MNPYESILERPHPVSSGRPRMSRRERAAQFAPYAALTGFGAAIEETERITEERIELDRDGAEQLDARFRRLREQLARQPEVTVVYFVPDRWKAGGAYETVTDRVRKLDELARTVTLASGAVLSMDDICALDGPLLRDGEERTP